MALLFMDGFDLGDYAQKYYATSYSSSSTVTRFGSGRSLLISPNGLNTGGAQKFINASSKVFVGGAFNPGNLTQSLILLYGDSGATAHLLLKLGSTGTLTVLRGSTVIASSSPGLITAGTWYSIEISATIDPTVGTCDVHLNGISVISFTGNTKNGGTNNTIDKVYLYNDSGNTSYYVDDLYICDGTGSAPYNTFLGDVRVATLSPNAAGSSTQLTPDTGTNYTRVNEIPYSAANYVAGTTPGLRDTYALSDLPAGTASVFAVQNNVVAKKTSTGAIAVKPAIKSGASVYYGATATPGTGDVTYTDLRITDPATSAAWTIAGVNALEAGLEIA